MLFGATVTGKKKKKGVLWLCETQTRTNELFGKHNWKEKKKAALPGTEQLPPQTHNCEPGTFGADRCNYTWLEVEQRGRAAELTRKRSRIKRFEELMRKLLINKSQMLMVTARCVEVGGGGGEGSTLSVFMPVIMLKVEKKQSKKIKKLLPSFP